MNLINLKILGSFGKSSRYLNFNPKDFYKKIKNGIYFDYLKLETMKNKQNGSLIQNIKQRERISEIVNFVHYANGDIEIFNLIPDNIIIHELNFNGNNFADCLRLSCFQRHSNCNAACQVGNPSI